MADSEIGALRQELIAIRDLLSQLVQQQGALIQALASEDNQEQELFDLEGHAFGRERPDFEEL